MKILIVDDEKALAEIIKSRLKQEKYQVDICTDGEEGLYQALNGLYDLLILDVMLPKIDGFEILKEVRETKIDSKVIMLTAKNSISDKLHGLTTGADDYLTKPFHMDELVARINIQLKRSNEIDNIIYGDLELDIKKSRLICLTTKEKVDLVCKEYQLLEYFMNNPDHILSKEQIYDKIWGINNESESNNLEVYLSFIRKKLKAIGSKVIIKSSRGLGYRMEQGNE